MNRSGTPLVTTRDVYDVAQLAGGLTRLVDTAVAALLERGRLTVDDAGRLQAVGSATHPVEAAVLELAGPRPRRSVASLRSAAQEDPRLTGVADRLVEQGLLRRNPFAALCSSWPAFRRTSAGSRVLAEVAQAPAGGRATEVALGGTARMADRFLADRAFGRPVPIRRAGVRPGDTGAGLWASGWIGGWGGDGGGGGGGFSGGGDGGSCGGGDGGGGGGC